MRRAAAGCVLAALAAAAAHAQGGAQVLSFRSTVDGSEQLYALYLPETLAAGKRYPLLVGLHAEESNHAVNLRRVLGAPSRYGELAPADLSRLRSGPPGFIVACPLARGSMGYQGIAERDVYDMLDDVERRFPVDRNRVSLTGISMGGGGALRLALTRPDVWAAVAPVCASPPPGLEELAGNALDLPVRLFHGEIDPLVPVETSRLWQRRLLDLGVDASYLEYPAVRHNAWDMAYRGGELFQWLEPMARRPLPERVRLATRSYRYGAAYWLRIDGLTPGNLATVDARLDGNRLEVETQAVDGFTVSPGRAVATVKIDGAVVHVRPGAPLAFSKADGRWRAGPRPPDGKHLGAEGPIAEAVAGRHIYVYGTGAARSADEVEARRLVAEQAAQWSSARSPLALTLPVKPDSAVTPEDIENADLVLFGTAQTNSLIARFAGRFPLALNAGAADYGLLFIAPIGKHYAMVSSGLPWRTGAEEAGRGGDAFLPPQYRLLTTFGDYILFKGSLAEVVMEGRFDRNWKVPAEAARKMLAAGTVTIH